MATEPIYPDGIKASRETSDVESTTGYSLVADKMEEECGIFGIVAPRAADTDVATLTYLGLHALQHRGQESAGICINDQGRFNLERGMGFVSSVFDESTLARMEGNTTVGHVRYSTTGSSKLTNAQPLVTKSSKGELALAHNGNLVNSQELRHNLEQRGSIFHSTLDTEVIAHLVARSLKDDLIEALTHSLQKVSGAFSLIAMTESALVVARDPLGFRPLALGKLDQGYVVASESCAFDIIGAEFLRDIQPGELLIITEKGIESMFFSKKKSPAFCVFEFIYFARPDSVINGQSVQLVREEMGRRLAREMDVEADLVVPVPTSGISAALGFARESGLPYKRGILKNRYVGRTFIQPTQAIRDLKVRIKLNPIREIVRDQRVVLIDDSIVRGTTSRQIISMIKQAGAREVHLAISSPPVAYPCYYGLDTSRRQELIAADSSIQEIYQKLGADSLTYLSQQGLLDSLANENNGYCTACFDGEYPLKQGNDKYLQKERG